MAFDSDEDLALWGVRIPRERLDDTQYRYLAKLEGKPLPSQEWLWQEMDKVWDSLGMDNTRPLCEQPTHEFYSHPVWLLNGIYSLVDPESAKHRDSIARYISRLGAHRIADVGGGFGALAKQIRSRNPTAAVDIVDPYSKSDVQPAIDRVEFVPRLGRDYDCVIAQDVLEHVERPIQVSVDMTKAASFDGYLIFANHFYPSIKCHLPSTFYLRYTFNFVARGLGLRIVGRVPGAEHAVVFKKVSRIRYPELHVRHGVAKQLGPVINRSRQTARRIFDSVLHGG